MDENWFNPTNVKALVDQKTQHPSTAGSAYYGDQLASDLKRIIKQR